jgi:DNA replication protein DnaC
MTASAKDFDKPLPQLNDHGLFLTGPSGHGKTHMATAVMRANLESALWRNKHFCPPQWTVSAQWVSVPDLFSQIKATFNADGKSARDVLMKYTNCRLLLLDDLGSEKSSDWTFGELYTLLSTRINELRPTIITSNLSRKEIDALDPRLGSRIGGMNPYILKTKDWRKVGTR